MSNLKLDFMSLIKTYIDKSKMSIDFVDSKPIVCRTTKHKGEKKRGKPNLTVYFYKGFSTTLCKATCCLSQALNITFYI